MIKRATSLRLVLRIRFLEHSFCHHHEHVALMDKGDPSHLSCDVRRSYTHVYDRQDQARRRGDFIRTSRAFLMHLLVRSSIHSPTSSSRWFIRVHHRFVFRPVLREIGNTNRYFLVGRSGSNPRSILIEIFVSCFQLCSGGRRNRRTSWTSWTIVHTCASHRHVRSERRTRKKQGRNEIRSLHSHPW